MQKDDPFGFNMSAAKDKQKRRGGRRGMSGAFETSKRECEHDGCTEAGQYRAPRSPDHLDEFKWFCKDHVRAYNLKWNFFDNATPEEMEEQQKASETGERPTKPFGRKVTSEERAWARLGVDDPHQVLGENATQNPGKSDPGASTRKLPAVERQAIEILEVKDHWTKAEIKKQYRSLIKILHPDVNGGDRSQEEQLQQVVWAWDQVKESRWFK